ncbi:Alpha-ketoglutarate permease isoform B [Micractinium conductrix]|nr:Alpha-ketoglutarate permease isoform B [Micractinium conductrix]|eukprot:PSC68521.1 Alpha-ketoglutarate permease isoform B [Micractinium conductrix]
MTSTLKAVFFPKSNPTAQTLLWWAVYAIGFVVRPLGALIFGSIGDIWGRQVTLRIAIIGMAIPTVIIGCLPTYNTGSYTAGIAAPILLTIMRLVQGFCMGGEFGPAIIYISELAPVNKRGRLVACLQMTVNIGMIIATFLAMLLQNTVSAEDLLVWGWRIPFLLAFVTALLGYYLRAGLPEPKAFLNAQRAEKKRIEKEAMANGEAVGDMAHAVSTKSMASIKSEDSGVDGESLAEEAYEAPEEEGALTKLHGHHHSKIPIFRVLMNNWLGLLINVMYMAWVSAAFYGMASWAPNQLIDKTLVHKAPTIVMQGIVIVSMLSNAVGLYLTGHMFDKGVKAIWINAGVMLAGMGTCVGVFYGVWETPYATQAKTLACWFLIPLFQFIVGMAMASVVLPATRIYAPLERTTGFSFAYNCGYGVVGGLTPFVVTSIIGDLDPALKAYAPSFWMLALGGASLLGCYLMKLYSPRLNKPFVGRIDAAMSAASLAQQRTRRLPPEVNRVLYVRNLPFNISAEEMYALFGKFGAIRQIRVGSSKETRGTAYIVYEDIYDAKTAVDHLSGFNVQNRYLIILYYNSTRHKQKLSLKDQEAELRRMQEKHGVDGEQHGKEKGGGAAK